MKSLVKPITIPDLTTGENIPLEKASPMQVSEYLTWVNTRVKRLKDIEVRIKKHFQPSLQFEENENSLIFGNHKVVRSYRKSFDKDKLNEEGTKKEKEWWNKLNSKFIRLTEVFTWK